MIDINKSNQKFLLDMENNIYSLYQEEYKLVLVLISAIVLSIWYLLCERNFRKSTIVIVVTMLLLGYITTNMSTYKENAYKNYLEVKNLMEIKSE